MSRRHRVDKQWARQLDLRHVPERHRGLARETVCGRRQRGADKGHAGPKEFLEGTVVRLGISIFQWKRSHWCAQGPFEVLHGGSMDLQRRDRRTASVRLDAEHDRGGETPLQRAGCQGNPDGRSERSVHGQVLPKRVTRRTKARFVDSPYDGDPKRRFSTSACGSAGARSSARCSVPRAASGSPARHCASARRTRTDASAAGSAAARWK